MKPVSMRPMTGPQTKWDCASILLVNPTGEHRLSYAMGPIQENEQNSSDPAHTSKASGPNGFAVANPSNSPSKDAQRPLALRSAIASRWQVGNIYTSSMGRCLKTAEAIAERTA